MFDNFIKKIVSTYFKFGEIPQKLLGYMSISLVLFICWQSLLLLVLEPTTAKAIHKATHEFLEFSFFMFIGAIVFFAKRWWEDRMRIEELMEDDPFTKISELSIMLTERDDKLKRSEARLRAIFRTAPIGIGLIDGSRYLIELNDYFFELLGYDFEELNGESILKLYPTKEEFERVGEIKYNLIQEKGMASLETQMKTKDGVIKDVLLCSTWLTRGDPNSGTVFTIMDMTELKDVTSNLKLDEERLEALLNLSQIEFKDEKSLIAYALEECVRLTGSDIGYFHFAHKSDSGDTDLSLNQWSKKTLENCTAEKIEHYPIHSAGIWADCIRLNRPVIHNDYENEIGKNTLPEGHFPVKRHMGVPIKNDDGALVGVVGVGNKQLHYDSADVRQLDLFASSIWRIIENKRKSLLFENIFETVNNGIAIYEPLSSGNDFIFKRVNKSSARIGKMTVANHIGSNLKSLYPGIEAMGLFKVLQEVNRTGVSMSLPLTRYDDDRLKLWVENFVFKTPSGEIVAVYNDVTEEKYLQETLAAGEERHRLFFENAPIGIGYYGKNGIVTDVNDKFLDIIGVQRERIVGTNVYDLKESSLYSHMIKSLEGSSEFYEGPYTSVIGGKKTYLKTWFLPIKRNDEIIGGVNIVEDITKDKQLESELKKSEEKFRRAIEYNIDAVILVNEDGIVHYVNPAMERLSGVPEEKLLNKQFGLPLEAENITSIDIVGGDGKMRCAEMRVSKIDHDNEIMYVVSLRDFTEVSEPCEEEVECPIKDYSNEDISS